MQKLAPLVGLLDIIRIHDSLQSPSRKNSIPILSANCLEVREFPLLNRTGICQLMETRSELTG
jgi:hypothetical protein